MNLMDKGIYKSIYPSFLLYLHHKIANTFISPSPF